MSRSTTVSLLSTSVKSKEKKLNTEELQFLELQRSKEKLLEESQKRKKYYEKLRAKLEAQKIRREQQEYQELLQVERERSKEEKRAKLGFV
mmetsp:Transcript_17939/g.30518  ORF Transcript_17939/g.30518 Transcript_17939/m.30518 type:complete len:91 (+) Transcript_17939:239-511(+)